MAPYLYPALYCLFVWWFSTGLIVFLDNLPAQTFRWSLIGGSAVAALAFWRLHASGTDTSVAGAYAAFTYGVLVWGWHEMAFFMGLVTGPRRLPAPRGVQGWARFRMGVAACLHHELAILACAALMVWMMWGKPNQVGTWTFMALWGMRQSAKLNVFLGVRNLGEQFLPAHLTYLTSFMARRRMNPLFPVSVAGGTLIVAFLVHRATMPGVTAFQTAGLTFVITMLTLAVIEHWLLILPLPFEKLWSWWLRHTRQEKPPSLALCVPEGTTLQDPPREHFAGSVAA